MSNSRTLKIVMRGVEGRAGVSNLWNRLTGKEYSEHAGFDLGSQITKTSLVIPDTASTIEYFLWDAVSGSLYDIIFQKCIPNTHLFILCVNATKFLNEHIEPAVTSINKQIVTITNNNNIPSKIFLVLTMVDLIDNHNLKLIEAKIKGLIQDQTIVNIDCFLFISTKTDFGLNILKEQIWNIAQSFRQSFQQFTELSDSLLDKLKREYFQPLISDLMDSKLNIMEMINEIFRNLQMCDAQSASSLQTRNALEFIDDFNLAQINHPNLKTNILKLATIYLKDENQQLEFPGIDRAQIQTSIRKLFHDYINPLQIFNSQSVNTNFISHRQPSFNQARLFGLPLDLQKIIYSNFRYESIIEFKKTCRSAYLLHKNRQDNLSNIFYLVAGDVKVSRPRRFYEFDLELPLRYKISDNEIISSLNQIFSDEKYKVVKLFPSLYHAIEYAHFKQNGHPIEGDEDAHFIPSIWAVSFVGNPKELQFSQTSFVINPDSQCSAYDGNRRNVQISFATVTAKSIQPLLGTVIFSASDFAKYHIYNVVDFIKHQNKNFASNTKRCLIM